jgi:hypothetical protein
VPAIACSSTSAGFHPAACCTHLQMLRQPLLQPLCFWSHQAAAHTHLCLARTALYSCRTDHKLTMWSAENAGTSKNMQRNTRANSFAVTRRRPHHPLQQAYARLRSSRPIHNAILDAEAWMQHTKDSLQVAAPQSVLSL